MKLRELTEAPNQFTYGMEGRPEWYDRAVQMKLDNPNITASEIGRQVGAAPISIIYWLTGNPGRRSPDSPRTGRSRDYSKRPHTKDWPPFKPEDFPIGTATKKYYDGAKPEWYDKALALAKTGESFLSIGKKIGVPGRTVNTWLVKGMKRPNGKLVNPDAEIERRKITGQKIDVNLLKDFIEDGYDDEDIIELVKDDKGPKIASQVRDMLPVLRKKLNPGTQVIDKTASGINNPVARPPKTKVTDM